MMQIKYPYRGKGSSFLAQLSKKQKPEFLLRLYQQMLRIRRIEEALATHYNQDQMKTPIHLAIGQEATAVRGRL